MAVVRLGQLNLEESPSRTVDRFEKLEQIGQGTSEQVYMARDIETGKLVALKKIRTTDTETEGYFEGREKHAEGKPVSNLLIDNKGNLKLGDFGLAWSFSLNNPQNLTNRVITLWYRPPELLLVQQIMHGKLIMPAKDEQEQVKMKFELCGTPDESNWPGVSKMPRHHKFKPTSPLKRQVRKVFRQ